YLDGGRLRFAEEMTSLSARFREIEVAVEGAPPRTGSERDWPSTWLRPEATASLVRFVETRFDPEQTDHEIRRRFAGVRNINVNPMPLRAIFLALARTQSKAV
ncbi:MAG TPA: hypothetical protein VGL72_05775, partial [Bryobacteraceae bacterium]